MNEEVDAELTVNEKGGIYLCLALWYASAPPYASDDAREVKGQRGEEPVSLPIIDRPGGGSDSDKPG